MRRNLICPFLAFVLIGLAGCSEVSSSRNAAIPLKASPASSSTAPAPVVYPVMLGIDVLEADGFAAVKGKKIGLRTHPAGKNRWGESTIDVLHRAPQTKLVALFAPEHGLYGTEKAGADVADTIDPRTRLPVFSLHGKNRKPTAEQLRGLDALVIDLQDIGVRSYSFNVAMRYAMESCFLHGVEVIVLDRPNPLGGLKVGGPGLDRDLMSGVGAFRMPYLYGLTLGELARVAASEPGVLELSEAVRATGRLTVVPMRGWRRTMRWPETGLRFVPTSPMIQDFAAVAGYAMIGLGCESSGFKSGIGQSHPFQTLSFKGKRPEQLRADLTALKIPGMRFQLPSATRGKGAASVFVEVSDWDACDPCELNFHLMVLACRYESDVFRKLPATSAQTFNKHVGSNAWWTALTRDGARVDLEKWLGEWRSEAKEFQERTRKYRLYD